MTTLPSDPDALYLLVEPLFGPLNERGADFVALRAQLPEAKPTTKRFRKRTTIEGALVVPGAAVFEHGVELAEGAATSSANGASARRSRARQASPRCASASACWMRARSSR